MMNLENAFHKKHFNDDSSEDDHNHDHENHDNCSDHLGSLENMDDNNEHDHNPYGTSPGT